MLRSRLVTFAGALALSGCYAGNDVYYYEDGSYDSYCAPGYDQSDIDTGSTLEIDPGVGAGVTVEYLGDGAWRFATACDTAYTGYACTWDVLVRGVDGDILGFKSESLERTDLLDWAPSVQGGPDDAVRLVATSDYDLDAFTLDAKPGATLEIDTLLDDYCGGTYVHWLHADNVVSGHTQTIDLTPSTP